MKIYPTALTIAGSDPSGGAGLQADIKTMSALGVYAASAVTALTVQNTRGVTATMAVPPQMVRAQVEAVLSDLRPQAVKIGMLGEAATARAVADSLEGCAAPVVLDPVMVSTSGHSLANAEAVEVMRQRLISRAVLVTPNMPEAEALAGMAIGSEADMLAAARRIVEEGGARAVLVKGGHGEGAEKRDLLLQAGREPLWYAAPSVDTQNTHGTGCTLSSAIAALLARGLSLSEAIAQAKDYITGALLAGAGVRVGDGHGPVNHFYHPLPLEAYTPSEGDDDTPAAEAK